MAPLRRPLSAPAIAVISFVILLVVPTGSLPGSSGSMLGVAARSDQLSIASQETTSMADAAPDGATPVDFSLNSTPINLSSLFWGTTVSPRARILPGQDDLFNATPNQVVVWPGANAGEDYNPLPRNNTTRWPDNNTLWVRDSTTGAVSFETPQTNETDFVSWCKEIQCTAIMQVPGEIDNATFAAQVVSYTLHTLNFTPAYWEIGNEPQLWRCWKLPWQNWTNQGCPGLVKKKYTAHFVTPWEYAWEVRNYTIAMRQVDPNIRIVGLPSTGRNNGNWSVGTWVYYSVLVNGLNISAVAFHEYPWGSHKELASNVTFYQAITPDSIAGLVQRTLQSRQNITLAAANSSDPACRATCGEAIQVFVTEIGSGLGSGRSQQVNFPIVSGFPGALSLAAQMTEAMNLNVSNLDVFAAVLGTANSWFNFSGNVRPDYTMYSQILNHLGTEAFPVQFSTPSVSCGDNTSLCANLYGIGTRDPSHYNRSDLMLVNLNATTTVTFDGSSPLLLPGIGSIANHGLEVWTWRGNLTNWNYSETPSPVAVYYPEGLPGDWTLPPQSVALLEAYPQGGVPVRITETGFTPTSKLGPRWFVIVGGMYAESNASTNVTFFLPPGQFSVTGVPIPLPLGGIERTPKERYEPFLPSTIEVGTSPLDIPARFVLQWNVSFAPGNLSGAGIVGPMPGWWNASTQLNLTAQPAFGYVFREWVEFENYSGANYTQVGEGYPANLTYTNTSGLFPDLSTWVNGSLSIKASFARAYPVEFVESGLAPGTNWSVTVRTSWKDSEKVTWNHQPLPNNTWKVYANDTLSSVTDSVDVPEANGTYAFSVDNVTGYRSLPVSANFSVQGGRVLVPINFTRVTGEPSTYAVSFEETGLPTGTPWSVTVRNDTVNSTGASVTFPELLNGSYGYVASTIDGFRAHPPAFGFNVSGPGLVILVEFAPVQYDVIWEETGLGNLSWSVNVSGQAFLSDGAWATAPLTNGSYLFTIPNVLDYVPQVRSGSFRVAGAGQVFVIPFVRASVPVTFTVSGLPTNAAWSVRLGNNSTALTYDISAGFREPNGTYQFNVSAPSGFVAVPSHGWVNVSGTPINISVKIVSLAPASTPPLWDLAFPALLVTAVAALAGYGTFLLIGARRRRRSGAKR